MATFISQFKRRNKMNTQQEDHEVTNNSAYNPFPEPQTIPSGWDTSTFSFEPQTDSDMDEKDSTES
jgi:hypothetical protein